MASQHLVVAKKRLEDYLLKLSERSSAPSSESAWWPRWLRASGWRCAAENQEVNLELIVPCRLLLFLSLLFVLADDD